MGNSLGTLSVDQAVGSRKTKREWMRPSWKWAESGSERGEGKVRRQTGEQRRHGLGDRSVPGDGRFGFVEHGVLGIEFTNRRDPSLGIALAEYTREIGLHETLVVDGIAR
jgi:hypothetical protein